MIDNKAHGKNKIIVNNLYPFINISRWLRMIGIDLSETTAQNKAYEAVDSMTKGLYQVEIHQFYTV